MEELKRCIAMAMDPRTSPSARDVANRQLCAFQNDPNSVSVCLEAFTHPETIDVTLLSFLMNVAKTQIWLFHERWHSDVRVGLRNAIVKCYVLPMFAGNPRTSEKMAQILTELVVREWPQLWPDAFDIVHNWLNSQPALGLLFLTNFLAVIRSEAGEGVAGGWSGERKAEVTAAFNEVLPGICHWLYARQVGNPTVNPTAVKIYGQLAGWAKLENHERFVEWCLDLLSSSLQEEAMEALSALPNRSLHQSSNEDCKLVEYVLGKGLRKFSIALETFVGSNYFLFRQLMDIITGLLSHLGSWNDQKIKLQVYGAILDLQLYLSHPSLYVRTALVMCILDTFKADVDSTSGLLEEVVEQAMPLLIAILAEDLDKTFKTADNQNDFDEFLEYQRTFGQLRGRIGEVVERMAKACPSCITKILSTQSAKLANGSSSDRWQMAILFLIQHGFADEYKASGALHDVSNRVVQLLQQHATQCTDVKLVEEALYALKSICLAMKSQQVYDECFRVFAHFAVAQQSDSCLQVRCRAMACFYQLASTKPVWFNRQLPQFLALVSSIKGQRELRTWVETVILMAGCEEIDASVRMEYYRAVLVPLLAQIESSCCRYMTDCSQFIAFCGLDWYISSDDRQIEPENAKNNRNSLANTLTLIQVTAKGLRGKVVDDAVRDVRANVFIPVLLNVLYLLSGAQSLVHGHPNYPRIFGEWPSTDDEDDNNDVEGRLFRYFNNWWSHIRTVCYMSLGHLCDCKYDAQRILMGFDRMKWSDRINLVRSALSAIIRAHGPDVVIARALLGFCKTDFQSPLYHDGDHRQAVEWMSAFTGFTCDALLKDGANQPDIFMAAIDIMIVCVQKGAAQSIISKWTNFLADHVESMVKMGNAELLRKLFTELSTVAIEQLSVRSNLHPQMSSVIFELFKASTSYGVYEVDHLLQKHAKIPGPEIDRIRSMFSATATRSKTARAALHTALQPLLRQAKPDTATVKKLVPDKLIIMSKLRRTAEQEELENRAIGEAADLFSS